jgi:IS5 family transposase
VAVFREFCRFDFGRERVPDATILLNLRHLLEEYNLNAALYA